MTLTAELPSGSFHCKKCEIIFNGDYNPQQRPRKSCPKCHKMAGLTVTKASKKTKSNKKPDTKTKGGGSSTPPSTHKKLTEEYIEDLIVQGLEDYPGNIQLIGKATEFFIKVKSKTSEMEEDMDISELLKNGIIKKFSE